jgi:hypothetical protein
MPISAIEAWRDPVQLEAQARPHYIDLEFHNWPHALAVRADTRANAQRCVDHGLTIDWDVLDPASLNHDGDFWIPPGSAPGYKYKTKERAAAAIVRREMPVLGMPADKIKHVSDIIKSSEKGVRCKTLEARCMRQADLANVAHPNPIVILNGTYRLYKETKRLNGEQPKPPSMRLPFLKDFLGFAAVSYEILTVYNDEDVSLGDFDRDQEGRSLFAQHAAKNIALLTPARLTDLLSRHLPSIVNYQPIGL